LRPCASARARISATIPIEGALAHFSSSTAIDLSRYDMHEPIRYVKIDVMNSAVDAITRLSSAD
jgi:hypothetical protein